jgi:hypothetical protein
VKTAIVSFILLFKRSPQTCDSILSRSPRDSVWGRRTIQIRSDFRSSISIAAHLRVRPMRLAPKLVCS